jgi:hypothetical protein
MGLLYYDTVTTTELILFYLNAFLIHDYLPKKLTTTGDKPFGEDCCELLESNISLVLIRM